MAAVLTVVPYDTPVGAMDSGGAEIRSTSSAGKSELDILKLLAKGLPDMEVAAKLGIDETSVKRDVQLLMTRLITSLGQALELLTDPKRELTVDVWLRLFWDSAREQGLVSEAFLLLSAAATHLPNPGISQSEKADNSRLTRREKEILQYVARGRRNYEIANELVISCRTVESHANAITRKLKARTRAHLLRRGVEMGALEVHSIFHPFGISEAVTPQPRFSPMWYRTQIMTGLSYGKFHQEIGKELSLDHAALEGHLKYLRDMLDARTSAEIVAFGAQRGLLSFG